jgi:hypothetical protein
MSAAAHFLLLNRSVNNRIADTGSAARLHPIGSTSFAPDAERSLLPVMFEKQSGSPVCLRTYDPVVDSDERSTLFSAFTLMAGCTREEKTTLRGVGLMRSLFTVLLLRQQMRGRVLLISVL